MSPLSETLNNMDGHGVLAHSVVGTVALVSWFDVNRFLAVIVSTVLGFVCQLLLVYIKNKLISKNYDAPTQNEKNGNV